MDREKDHVEWWREVSRTAYELKARHLPGADHKYAARLAARALAEGKLDEHQFWKDVEESLAVRPGEN
jgi:hypothetical protein